ncbi:MAG TPA: hypothetical protein VMT10_07945 [Solirubrobacteraceae bacterium]|nr:hypothetical protein [Solirubrobacteraceae bacterium]
MTDAATPALAQAAKVADARNVDPIAARMPLHRHTRTLRLLIAALAACATASALGVLPAAANTSHAGWPQINGMLLMNKLDQNRPLDARPGHDPFDGTDPAYRCDGMHQDSSCVGLPRHCHRRDVNCKHPVVVADAPRHNELLGGHGNDTIHASRWGDVIWGDYKPSGQPTAQVDRLYGGPGKDFIYASHGWNTIVTGGGPDIVHAHFGHGSITCSSPNVTVFLSRHSRRGYSLHGCRRISYKTLGY